MASSPVTMTMEEYLHTSFHPDAHFVDGRIEQRVAGYYPHSHMLGQLVGRLGMSSDEYDGCLILRLRVSPTRVRVCDFVLLDPSAPDEQIPSYPPLVCIEVLDTTEKPQDAIPASADYSAMGVKNVWLIDIAGRTSYVYEDGVLESSGNLLSNDKLNIRLEIDTLFDN